MVRLGDEVLVDQALVDDHVHHRVEQRDVGVGLELQVAVRDARELASGAGRITISLVPFFDRVLDPGRGHRVVHRRVGADQDHHLGLASRPSPGCDTAPEPMPSSSAATRRGMAQPRAVVDVVAAEAGAHQLLEQVGLLVAALGRAEAGQRLACRAGRGSRELAAGERRAPRPSVASRNTSITSVRVHREVAALGRVGAADQRLGQALRMVRVVEAVAALDAQARRGWPGRRGLRRRGSCCP